MSETIGFIGLGNMGVPMAGRLIDGGHALVVNDIRQDAARPLLARGATWAASPAEVAAAAQTVITILPTSREVREVLLGAKGLLDALRPGSLVLEMTSADPSATRGLQRERPQVPALHPQRGLRRRLRDPAHDEGSRRLRPARPGGGGALAGGPRRRRGLPARDGPRHGRAGPHRDRANHRGVGGRLAPIPGRHGMTRIGFIGVGTMGLPMAKNLVKKGFTVTAFDSNPEAGKAAAGAGMTPAASSGEVVKLCNNLIAGVCGVAVSEAFRIAEGFGMDPKVVTDVISKSSGNTFLMGFMHPVPGVMPAAASSNDYKPGFMTDLMCKDLGLAVDAARNLRVPLFVTPAAQQVYRLASSHGLGRRDFTSVYSFLKPSSGQAPV